MALYRMADDFFALLDGTLDGALEDAVADARADTVSLNTGVV